MDNEQYKISLGIELNTDGLQEKINEAGRKAKPIELDVELKSVNDDIKEIKAQLNSLGKNGSISINTDGIEKSLTKVSNLIENISRSIGTLNTKKGTSIVTTINHINKALQSATKQFEQLNKSLNILSGKDLNLNFNLKAGNSSPVKALTEYGIAARTEAIPAMKEQIKYLQGVLGGTQKAEQALQRYIVAQEKSSASFSSAGNLNRIAGGLADDNGKTPSLSEQMQANAKLIDYYKEIVLRARGASGLDDFDANFSKSAQEIIKETVNIQSGTQQAKEEVQELGQAFKTAFGGGNNLNVEGVSTQLESIVADLGEIRKALVGLPEEEVDGLTQNINKLSTALNELVKNVGNVKPALDKSISNVGADATTGINKQTEKYIEQEKKEAQQAQETANVVVQSEQKKQQAYFGTFNSFKELKDQLQKLNIKNASIDAITKDFEELGITVKNITSRLGKDGSIAITLKGIDEAGNAVTAMRKFDALGNKIGFGSSISQDFNQTKEAFTELKSIAREINGLELNLAGLDADKDAAEIDELTVRLGKLYEAYDDLYAITSKNLKDSEISQLNKIAEDGANKLRELESEKVKSINENLEFGDKGLSNYDKQIAAVETKFGSLGNQSVELKEKIASLHTEMANMQAASAAGNNNALIEANKRYEATLKEVNNELDINIQKQKQATAEQKATKQVQAELNKTVDNLAAQQKKIGDLKAEIKKLENIGGRSNEVDFLKKQLEELEATYKSLRATFDNDVAMSGVESLVDTSKIDAEVEKTEARLEQLQRQYEDTRTNLAKDIEIDLKTGKFTSQVEKISNDAKKISGEVSTLKTKLELLNNAEEAMNNAFKTGSVEERITAYNNYVIALKNAEIQLERNQRAEKEANEEQKLENDRRLFQNNIDAWLNKNSAASEKFGERLRQMRAEAQSCNRIKLDNLEAELKQIDKAAEGAGLKMQKFSDRLKTQLSKYASYFSIASVFMYVEQGLRDMFEQVVAIDTAMTELKKVTDETDASYNQFLKNAASRSKEIGTTIDGLVKSTADFARLGYGFKDAQGLAEVANIYAVVGDEIDDVEQATESLISTMAAFKDEANSMGNSDFAMSIVDKFNEIGNNFAISSGGIGDALERSASSLKAANNTIDESIALITAANTVVQDPDAVGTAFKTISMRIRGAKSELEDAGLETEGMVESTSKLRQEIMALSGVDIMESDGQTFKSTYAILDKLAKKWKDLSDIQQATITELIAGKRQGNIISSLMNNFQTARDALNVSIGSSGSAMKEHAKWSESLEARLNKLSSAWQSLSQTFMSSDFLKVSIDFITSLVKAIDGLIDSLGSFGTIGLGAAIVGIVKNFGTLNTIFTSLIKKTAGAAIGFKALGSSVSGVVGGIGLLVAAIGLAYNIYKNAKEVAAEARQEAIESSDAYLDAATSFEKAYIKYSGKMDLTASEEEELKSAIDGTVSALGDKSSALQSAVNSSNDYLASLEAIKDAELEAAKNAAEDKIEAAAGDLKEAAIGWESLDGSEVNISISNDKAANIAKEIGGDFYKNYKTDVGRGDDYESFKLELSGNADTSDILNYYNMLLDYKDALSDAGLEDSMDYENVSSAIERMSESIGVYTDGVYEAVKANYQLNEGIPKTAEEYIAMREAILTDEQLSGFSLDKKMSVLNALDSDYGQLFDLSSAEAQARKFVGIIKGYGDGTKDGTDEIGTVETFLNMRTAVNNNECTVGQYLSQFDEINSMRKKWSDKEKEEFDLAFGIDADAIKKQYDNVYNYLSRNYLNKDTRNMDRDEERYYKLDVRENQKKIKEFLNGLSASELAAVVDIKAEIDWENASEEDIRKQIEERVKINEALSFEANIEIDTTALETLNTALEESASAIGLSTEAIESLKAKYADLDGYDPATLFERTANGVKVNREELAKLEKKYNDLNKSEVQEHIDNLTEAYNDNAVAIDECSNAGERAQLIAKGETYKNKIEELATYQAQLEGVTGAYQRWLDAQNTPEDYEGYELVATSREDIKDEIDRGFISNASKEYIDLLSGKDLTGGTIDDYANAWEKLDDKVTGAGHSINDFFTVNDDGDITATGIDRFFKSVQTDFKGSVAEFNKETGKWEYNFSQENLQKIQDEWGLGIEAIELLLEAAASAGYDVDWSGILDNIDLDTSSFETLVQCAETMQTAYNKIDGLEDVHFNFTATGVEEAESEIEKARQAFSQFINADGTVNIEADGAEEMQFILTTLIIQKQQLSTPAIMKVDTSQIDQAETDIIDVITAAQQLQTAYENYEIAISTGVDVEKAKGDLESAITELQNAGGESGVDIKASLKLPTNDELETAKGSLGDIEVGATLDGTSVGAIETQIQTQCTPEIIATVTGIDESAITNGEGGRQVKYTPEHSEVDAYINSLTDINKKIIFKYTVDDTNKPNPKNIERTITYKYQTEGDVPEATGTAHIGGTASGRAFARGNWGIKGSGTALGGELGQELVVRDGKFFTIGDKGAEFFRYKPNDIIFNAAQTESLFKYGGIKGAKPRGTMLATGTAFAGGSRPSSGKAFAWSASASLSRFAESRLKDSAKKSKDTKKTTTAATKALESELTKMATTAAKVVGSEFAKNREQIAKQASSGSSSGSSDKFEETIDWIETAISRIERAIDQLDQKANNVYASWSSRNSALADQLVKVGDEIDLQQQAYDRYIKEANSVGLSEAYAKKVRNGTINIEDFEGKSDEALVEKIKEYQEWYEKALDCEDAILELKETEASLYAQRFENIQTQYDSILQGYEHTEAMLNEYISQAEEQGYIVSKKYYNALIENEKSNIDELEREQADLIAARDEAVDSGKIIKGSEEWYNMCAEIDSVTQAIEESTTALLEYDNAMRDIDWQIFDLIQERISDVTKEADFLIELMSNKKLYDDDGKLTSQGLATMALHSQNYNSHMYAADTYGEEVAKLDAQIANDPYDQELINRRNELLELQRESILAAEDEKNAIRDMVEEGIELELDALQERIDKYNESIDAAKDLYDYQKDVQKQSEEIASLEKQRAAYLGDNSEESKAKLQEIEVSLKEAKENLQETEYDKYISDQQALLDTLYNEYELILNQRLDNVDYLLEQVIESINIAASAEGNIATALGSEGAIAIAVSNNATSIKETLTSETNKVGTTLSSAMNAIWNGGDGDAKSVLTMYGEDFKTKSTTIITTLNGIKSSVNSMVSSLNKDATAKTKANKTATSAKKNPTTTNTSKNGTPTSNKSKITGDTIKGVAAAIWIYGKDSGWGNNPFRENKLTQKLGAANAKKVQEYVNKHGANGDLYDYWLKQKDKSLAKYKYSAFKFGAKLIDESQLAWTQEGYRKEFIVRPSDGAILTPVAKGDSILTSAASGNIWNMANNPAEFIKENLGIGSANVPSAQNINNTYTQHIDNVVFRMDNVKNYDEMLSAMQKDKNFERLVLSMSIDQIAGKSKLAKGKSIR